MNGAWTVATVAIALLVAVIIAAVARGFRQAARESHRRDLITLHSAKSAAEMFTKTLDGMPAYAFAPPFATGREQPIGWLWWRAEQDENGQLVHHSGWALTYRAARRAAGAPVSWKNSELEFIIRR